MVTVSMPSSSSMASPNDCRKQPLSFWREIFDPQSKFVKSYNKFLLFTGLFSLYLDSYFFYLPILKDSGPMSLDLQVGVHIAVIRVIGDFILFSGVLLKFRTACEDPAFHVFGKRELIRVPRIIATRYLKSRFIIDFLSSLPLPQAYLGYHILKTTQATEVYYQLVRILSAQFCFKFAGVLIIYGEVEKNTGIAIKNPWSGTLYILFVYGMLSHFLGAAYYFLYIDDSLLCETMEIQEEANAVIYESSQLFADCPHNRTEYKGLLSDAYANDIASRSFTQKFMFCFSWGLKTLSSMGQNLDSNAFILDNFFNLLVIIIGLLLFADLIARMQTCMQSVGEQEEQQMVRQRELVEWAKFHQLPGDLRKRVEQTVQFQFFATRGIDDEAILDSLPLDLRCEIRRYLYLGLVRTLPIFEGMDDQLLHAVCGHLRAFSAVEGMFIVLEGDPVHQILFILTGQLEIFSIDGGCSSCVTVGPGGLCGQELLAWCSLSITSTQSLPSSTCTVKCLTNVEAFSLQAQDVKLLAVQLNYDLKFFDALSRDSV